MALVSAEKFGVHASNTIHGEPLLASDGNGDLLDEAIEASVASAYETAVSADELARLIYHGASKDIATGQISRPPKVERTLELAQSFYDTYLFDTLVDRVEVVSRYAAALIEQLEALPELEVPMNEEYVKQYVGSIHDLALAA